MGDATMDPSFQPFGDELWLAPRPLKFYGVEVGTRMTVIRLDGGLFLHSPVALDPQTLFSLQNLAPVKSIVAPNALHHLFLSDYFKVFPEAKVYAAPGLEKKRRDLVFHCILSDQVEAEWQREMDQVLVPELPMLKNEVVFLHHKSRTLLLTDLAFYIGREAPFLTRLTTRLLGAYGQFGPDRILRRRIRDRKNIQEALLKILSWDFDRIILAHGKLIEKGGKDVFAKAFSPLLETS